MLKGSFSRLWHKNQAQRLKKQLESQGVFIEGHKSQIRCIAITNDDKYLFTGSDDKTIRV